MSDSERPDAPAFRELELLVRNLGEELAGFRRRALQAEGRVKSLEEAGASPERFAPDRVSTLERENEQLRARLQAATLRTRRMLDRVRFLRQQHGRGAQR